MGSPTVCTVTVLKKRGGLPLGIMSPEHVCGQTEPQGQTGQHSNEHMHSFVDKQIPARLDPLVISMKTAFQKLGEKPCMAFSIITLDKARSLTDPWLLQRPFGHLASRYSMSTVTLPRSPGHLLRPTLARPINILKSLPSSTVGSFFSSAVSALANSD